MAFNWDDFLALAKNITPATSNVGPREAALRSAVSRAYYSAYHAALALGKRSGFQITGTGTDHFSIRKHFRQIKNGHPKNSSISMQLDRLYDYRRKADYVAILRETPEHLAQNAIGIAKIIFDTIEEIQR
jgi:uncharacterized protein (UPF0332 family)